MTKANKFDYCNEVTHFTKGDLENALETSYQTFTKIIKEEILVGNNKNIESNDKVICFSESPYHCLKQNGKLNKEHFKTYSPFGFQICKKYLYEKGGRPVIYSNKNEIQYLADEIKWRHANLQPNWYAPEEQKSDPSKKYDNYSWQREWRIKIDSMQLNPNEIKLVFPNKDWIDRFIREHTKEFHNPDCETCPCQVECEIIDYKEYFDPIEYSKIENKCPIPAKFKWILINMNGDMSELEEYYQEEFNKRKAVINTRSPR